MNMKRFSRAWLTVSLVGIAALLLAACAAQKGPLSPSTSLINPTSVGTGYPRVVSVAPVGAAMAVSQTVRVVFNMAMNPSSFNQATVAITKEDVSGLSEAAYTFYTLQYEPQLKTLFIKPDPAHNSGFWDDNAYYRLALSPSLASVTGAQLDGNSNNLPEGAAFDTFHAALYTGTPSAPGYSNIPTNGGPLTAFKLSSVLVEYYVADAAGNTTQASDSIGTGNLGQVAASLPVTVTATFDHRLDPTTWIGATTLPSAISFTDANGTAVVPTNVTLTAGNTAILAHFASGLSPNTSYQVYIKGGLTGLRSSNEVFEPLMRYLYFSGKGHDYASAADDTPVIHIFTTGGAWTNPAASTPPTVNKTNVVWDSTNRRYVIPFTTTSGNHKMDESTLNSANLKLMMYVPDLLIASAPGVNFSLQEAQGSLLPKDIVYDLAFNTVYVYVPNDFIPPRAGYDYAWFKVFIGHNIRSADGLYFDGNGDGVATQDYNDDVFTGNAGPFAIKCYNLMGEIGGGGAIIY